MIPSKQIILDVIWGMPAQRAARTRPPSMLESPMAHETSNPMMSAMDKKHQAENDVHTLVEAGEIKEDKARYKSAMAMAKKQQAVLKYIDMDSGELDDYAKTAEYA